MIFIAVMKFYFTLVMEWLHVYLQFLLCEDIVSLPPVVLLCMFTVPYCSGSRNQVLMPSSMTGEYSTLLWRN